MWVESTVGHSIVNVCAVKICVTSKLNQPLTFEYAILSCYQHIYFFIWYLILFEEEELRSLEEAGVNRVFVHRTS